MVNSTKANPASNECVRVVTRCRPFSEKEKAAGHSDVVVIDSQNAELQIMNPAAPGEPPKTFTYDAVFGQDSTQREVYNASARPIVEAVLEGYNGTVFCYGQTGTGKSYTMEGKAGDPKHRGILHGAVEHIFAHIETAPPNQRYLVRGSYMEIYNEELRDLLVNVGPNKPLKGKKPPKLDIRDQKGGDGVYVSGLSSHVVRDCAELANLVASGNSQRAVAYTAMNATSSRSHAIFTVTVEVATSSTEPGGEESLRAGRLHLVDLAGSERQSKTQATGDRLKEAAKINLSLSALGNVVSALAEGGNGHIPYRDSKLTRLLQDSLGGNAKTLIVATMSPASYNYDETISTLRYASRAKNIKNKPKINEDPKDAMLRQYREEIEALRKQLESGEFGSGDEEVEEVVEEEVEEVVEEEEEEDDEGEEEEGSETAADATRSTQPSETTDVASSPESICQAATKPNAAKRKKSVKLIVKKKTVPKKERNPEECEAKSKLDEMAKTVAAEKESIVDHTNQLAEEAHAIKREAVARARQINKAKRSQEKLESRLAELQGGLLVGGVNILDKAAQQQQELAKAAAALEAEKIQQRILARELQEREDAKLMISESYATLREESDAKTRKLKRAWQLVQAHRTEIQDIVDEHKRERDELLATIKELNRELGWRSALVDRFVPREEQALVEQATSYDDDADDRLHVACVMYAGNNIRRSGAFRGMLRP